MIRYICLKVGCGTQPTVSTPHGGTGYRYQRTAYGFHTPRWHGVPVPPHSLRFPHPGLCGAPRAAVARSHKPEMYRSIAKYLPWPSDMIKLLIPLFTLCLLLAYSMPVQAQEKTPVTVYLKNGKSIHGAIISTIFDEYMTLEIDPVTHIDISFDKIRMITFGHVDSIPQKEAVPAKPYEPRTGFTYTVGLGMLIGQNEYGSTFSLSMVNGYRFTSGWQTGLGIGLDFLGSVTSLPVYAQLKADLTKRKVTPYAYLDAGYGIAWANNRDGFMTDAHAKGGWMVQPGFGYRFNMKSTAFVLGFGYRLQKVTLDYTMPNWGSDASFHEERIFRRFSLSAGLSF